MVPREVIVLYQRFGHCIALFRSSIVPIRLRRNRKFERTHIQESTRQTLIRRFLQVRILQYNSRVLPT